MAGYDQTIKVKAAFVAEAKHFFSFLRAVGRKYARPVQVRYRHLGRGRFYVMVDGGPGGIDSLFQEMILNRGLHYYICSIRSSQKTNLVRQAILPIFREMVEYRFENPCSRFLRKHVDATISPEQFVPGEFHNPFSHEYEVLFRKWDIGLLDEANFIQDIDSFLTRFMLTAVRHRPGDHSPPFHMLVRAAAKQGIAMSPAVARLFNEVHHARTLGLHRMKTNLTREDVAKFAMNLYSYFDYFDEFQQSQETKTVINRGKRYRRLKYGAENRFDLKNEGRKPDANGVLPSWLSMFDIPCHDCDALKSQYHLLGCDFEECPKCHEQFISCSCRWN